MAAASTPIAPETTAPPEDDLLLERQLCFALTVASRSVVGVYKPVLEKMGLTHPQYLVMLALWERSPRTLKDISEASCTSQPPFHPSCAGSKKQDS